MQVAEGGCGSIAKQGHIRIAARVNRSGDGMTITVEDATIGLFLLRGDSGAHRDVSHQHGVDILAALGILHGIGKGFPVVGRSNLKYLALSLEGQWRRTSFYQEFYLEVHARANERQFLAARLHLVSCQHVGGRVYGLFGTIG